MFGTTLFGGVLTNTGYGPVARTPFAKHAAALLTVTSTPGVLSRACAHHVLSPWAAKALGWSPGAIDICGVLAHSIASCTCALQAFPSGWRRFSLAGTRTDATSKVGVSLSEKKELRKPGATAERAGEGTTTPLQGLLQAERRKKQGKVPGGHGG